MNTVLTNQLKKRLRSFGWRALMMGVAVVFSFMLDNAVALELPALAVVVVGLMLGEVSKYLNKNGK